MKGLNKKKIAILVIAEIVTVVMAMLAHSSFFVTLLLVVLTGVGTILLSALYEWRLVVGLIISTLVSCILVLKLLGWGWALVLLLILLVVLWWKWQFFAKITSTTKFLLSALTILLILLMVLLFPSKTGDNNQKVATEKKTTFGEMSGETSSSEVNSEDKPGEYESNPTEEETTFQKVEGLTKDGANAGSTTGNTNVSTKAKSDSENKGTSGNGSGGSTQDTQETTEDPNSEPSTNQKASEKASEIGQGTKNPEEPVTGKPEGKTVVPTTEVPAEVQTTKKKFEPEEETTSVKKLEPITPTQTPTTKVVTQPTTKTVTQPTTKVVTQPTTKVMTQPTTQQPTTQQPTTQAHAATITVAYTEGSAVARVAVSANFTPLVTTTWKKAGASCSAKVISNDGNNVIIEVDVPANFKDTLWVRVFDEGSVERAQYVKKINNLGH